MDFSAVTQKRLEHSSPNLTNCAPSPDGKQSMFLLATIKQYRVSLHKDTTKTKGRPRKTSLQLLLCRCSLRLLAPQYS